MKRQRRIVGVDPGTEFVGYAVLEHDLDSGKGLRLLECDRIHAQGSKAFRLYWIHEKMEELFLRYKDQRIDLAMEQTFVGSNAAVAIVMGEGRGAILAAAGAVRGIRVSDYMPSVAKKAIAGNGSASKYQVAAAVSLILQLPDLVSLDASDAAAIALHHYHLGSRREE